MSHLFLFHTYICPIFSSFTPTYVPSFPLSYLHMSHLFRFHTYICPIFTSSSSHLHPSHSCLLLPLLSPPQILLKTFNFLFTSSSPHPNPSSSPQHLHHSTCTTTPTPPHILNCMLLWVALVTSLFEKWCAHNTWNVVCCTQSSTQSTQPYRSKRSVLRRQSRDTNRNIKRSVYCQYG